MGKKKISERIMVGVVIIAAGALLINSLKDNDIRQVFNKNQNAADSQEEIPKEAIEGIELNEDFFESLSDKEKVHYMLLNSIDYFETVSGVMEKTENLKTINATENSTTTFYYDMKSLRSNVHEACDSEGVDRTTIYNNDTSISKNNIDKTFRKLKVAESAEEAIKKTNDLNKLKPRQRQGRNRWRKFILSEDFIMPEPGLCDVMMDYDKWDIDGEEEYLGITCTKISGNKRSADHNTGGEKYVVLVDSNTGIVLKYEEMDSENNVVYSLKLTSIEYNKDFDDSLFDTSVEGYTEKQFGDVKK